MNTENIIITKVRIKDGRVLIRYLDDQGSDKNKYSLDSFEAPLARFPAALSALAVHVARICELPEEDAKQIDIIGVTYSYKDGIMGATITGLKHLSTSNAPLVINTPHKAEAPYTEGGDDLNCLDEDTVSALGELSAEARNYIAGERAQVELFDEDAA